jgi:peptide/nickel transport system permease protein
MGQLIGALAGRLAQLAAMLLAVVLLCFAAMQALPGDKALQLAVARHGERATEAGIAQAQRDGGFDRSMAAQFADWAGRLVRLDLGHSLVSRRPVAEELGPRLRVTLLAGAASVLLGLAIGLPLGLWAGLRPGGLADGAVAVAAALFSAVPAFLLGLVLMMLFAIRLGWLPAAGSSSLLHFVLPVCTLALGFAAPLARVTRLAVLEAWGAFPVTFGRLKGLSPARAGLRHGVRNAAIPVVMLAGLRFAAVIEGFAVIETLFNLPGLGDLLVRALVARDIPTVQAAALLFGLIYGAVGLLLDAACAAIDPRRRLRLRPL